MTRRLLAKARAAAPRAHAALLRGAHRRLAEAARDLRERDPEGHARLVAALRRIIERVEGEEREL